MTKIPNTFQVLFKTTQGDITIKAHRDWSPKGVERFYELVSHGFFNDTRIFRVKPGFVVQFGINGNPDVTKVWKEKFIEDEPVKVSNVKGTVAFAMDEKPNSRATQIFINTADNPGLDGRKFAPFATVIKGIEIADKFFSGYGERFREQTEIEEQGNLFLDEKFPKMDRILSAQIL
jgi:peptidyl-prolyl cis-trans isomerase A (cyclophilin A)